MSSNGVLTVLLWTLLNHEKGIPYRSVAGKSIFQFGFEKKVSVRENTVQ